MDENPILPDKKTFAKSLLSKGNVFLHLDPRKNGVVVPDWLKNQLQLVLQIGNDLPIRIPDLSVNDDGVFGTLSFNRSPFTCWVPWDSLFAMVGENGRGMVWMSDMPAEIAAEIEREMRKSEMIGFSSNIRSDRKGKRNNKNSGIKASTDAAAGPSTKETNDTPSIKRRRVASKRAKEEAIPTPPQCSPSPVEEKNRDSDSLAVGRGRKRKTRELPPYLRVIK